MKDKKQDKQASPAKNAAGGIMTPEPRFPRAAVDYIDALLRIQRNRFEQETNARQSHLKALADKTSTPPKADIFVESDQFQGTGWSDLGHRRDGTAFRWMGRIGTLLLPVDLSAGGTVEITGSGFSRRRHLKTMSFWIDDEPLDGAISRQGFNRWTFRGTIPALPARPYSILRLQSAGQSRLAIGVDTYVSVAVSRVQVTGG